MLARQPALLGGTVEGRDRVLLVEFALVLVGHVGDEGSDWHCSLGRVSFAASKEGTEVAAEATVHKAVRNGVGAARAEAQQVTGGNEVDADPLGQTATAAVHQTRLVEG